MVFQTDVDVAAPADGYLASSDFAERHGCFESASRARQFYPTTVEIGKARLNREREHLSSTPMEVAACT
jgi:hypothetical protein